MEASELDADQPAHSALGASGAARWLNCPGSFALVRQAPVQRPSVYAAAGILAHSLIERALSKGPDFLDQMRGSLVPVAGYDIAIDDDFIEGIATMLNYVVDRSIEADLVPILIEETVYLDSYFRPYTPPPVRLFGRVDLAMMNLTGSLLEIIDYKNGAGVLVTPKNNPQMMYYAAGALANLPLLDWPDTIRLTVVQPHAPGQDKVRFVEISFAELQNWIGNVLLPGVYACGQPDAPLNPGSYCRFCPASAMCPALRAEANKLAKTSFSDHVLPQDPEQLAEDLRTAELAEAWIDALRTYAVEQLKAQVRIPGWGLGPTRPTRQWKDADAIERIVLTLGWNKEAYRHDLLSPAQMEKLARRKGIVWQSQFAPLVESVSSGVKLVRDNAEGPTEFDDNVKE